MIEGPGHMALIEVAGNVMLEKRLCHGAPFYVLGSIVTDVAPGYDHVTSAIGGAAPAAAGADIAKGIPGAGNRDDAMARERENLDRACRFALAMDPEKASRYRKGSTPEHEDRCTMRAVRTMNRVLAGKDIQLDE
jgi:phosphomethylpyrimidine synthase